MLYKITETIYRENESPVINIEYGADYGELKDKFLQIQEDLMVEECYKDRYTWSFVKNVGSTIIEVVLQEVLV
jgi:hypothetical protein